MHMKQDPGTDLVPTGINLTGESPVQFRYFVVAHFEAVNISYIYANFSIPQTFT